MSTVTEKRRYTIQEYLDRERNSPTKHQFCRGEIVAMAGTSPRHNRIAGNLLARLVALLESTPCEVYCSDQRLRIDAVDLSTYADVSIICGEMKLDGVDRIAATNPRVIVEVLSHSTERYDRGKKFRFYQHMASLEEYLLVAQDEPFITQLSRGDNSTWRYASIEGMEKVLQLACLPIRLPLTEIYRNVAFGLEDGSEGDSCYLDSLSFL